MYQIGVDIGGTFTDCVVLDEHGRRTVAKAFSTPADPIAGVLEAVDRAAGRLGISLPTLLSETTAFVHSSTVTRNTVLERKGAPTALLTTRGHEDTIFIGRGSQQWAGLAPSALRHATQLDKAEPPLVPPKLVRGIIERIDADGQVVVPLDLDQAGRIVDELVAQGIESVAICLLWSFLNPAHERAVRDDIAKHHPKLFTAISSEVAPLLGEYERTMTTVLNAYLGPPLTRYLEQLEQRLHEQGYRYPLLVLQADGGLATATEAARRAVLTLGAGPVGGTLGALHLSREYGEPNVLCLDIGGSSADLSLIARGELQYTSEQVVDRYAYHARTVEARSIGAGGGSIAWIDQAGVLRVGPRGAGAMPGPACYGRGGTEPTVTDACLLLGYLNAEFFLGGRIRLDVAAAERAIASVAEPLGLTPVEAAAGILRIASAQLADLIHSAAVEHGLTPRDTLLCTYGGAGGLHAALLAAELAPRGVVIMTEAAAFAAFGLLTADMTHSAEASLLLRLPWNQEQCDASNRLLEELQQQVFATFAREGIEPAQVRIERRASLRYRHQARAFEIVLPDRTLTIADAELLATRLAERYHAVLGEPGSDIAPQAGDVELVALRVTGAHQALKPPSLLYSATGQSTDGRSTTSQARLGTRPAYFAEAGGFVDAIVYDGEGLQGTSGLHPGDQIEGPAIVERLGDTIVVPPGYVLLVDEFRNLHLSQERP